jgi:hypothetical protein
MAKPRPPGRLSQRRPSIRPWSHHRSSLPTEPRIAATRASVIPPCTLVYSWSVIDDGIGARVVPVGAEIRPVDLACSERPMARDPAVDVEPATQAVATTLAVSTATPIITSVRLIEHPGQGHRPMAAVSDRVLKHAARLCRVVHVRCDWRHTDRTSCSARDSAGGTPGANGLAVVRTPD